jgi:hypothetical protein
MFSRPIRVIECSFKVAYKRNERRDWTGVIVQNECGNFGTSADLKQN